jgi:8-oxo-dGTP pyrophosphatase MutT (NUDIX family)
MKEPAIVRLPLRWSATAFQAVRRARWYFTHPRTFGVHAVAVTPRGTIVLVLLRYAPKWRLPGGGRAEDEDPREAVLRELREEIGMTAHGAVEPVADLEENPDFKRDAVSIFIVRDVEYRPRWSLEVEAVTETRLDALPEDMSPRAQRWLDLAALRI